jgi:hypothetical protein
MSKLLGIFMSKYVILMFVWFLGCKTKIEEVYYDSGELKESYSLVNGEKDGLCYRYYKSGKLLNVVNWENGFRNGLVKHYYESGEIETNSFLLKNIPEGKICFYFENGIKRKEFYRVQDTVTGPVREFDENGNIKYASLYLKGESLLFGEFDETGKVVGKNYFFVDIITPDSIFQEEDVEIEIKVYDDTNLFGDLEIRKGEIFDDVGSTTVSERLKVKGDNIKIKLLTNKKGFNYWNGVLECTSELDSTSYALYPICFSYYVR